MSKSRPIREVLARVTACAAVLATSLFGRSLHELQHRIIDLSSRSTSNAPTSDDTPRCSCAFHVHCQTNTNENSKHNDSRDTHDSHDCAVCYVIGLAATSVTIVTVLQTDVPLADRIDLQDESIATAFSADSNARGPPVA